MERVQVPVTGRLLHALVLLLLLAKTGALTRDFGQLHEWAVRNNVEFHPNLQFVQHGADNWSLELERRVPKHTLLMSVPRELTWKAQIIRDAMDPDVLARVVQTMEKNHLTEHIDAFLLFIRLLEDFQDSDSQHKIWFDNLPTSYTSGLSLKSSEKACLPVFARALAKQEQTKYQIFCTAANVPQTDHTRRMYNTVFSRCWKVENSTDLVPIGDMFNHGYPANVFVEPNERSIDFFYKGGDDTTLSLNYGNPSNPHRFLMVFGFVDPNMVELWSHLVFPNPDERHMALGCDDAVFRTDGAVSNAVYDSILYALLQSQPDLQSVLYEAHIKDDKQTKSQLHDAFAQPVEEILFNHVNGQLNELRRLRERIDVQDSTDNLKLIQSHNELLTKVFKNVKARLTSRM